ncbi:Uncharacterised protein [uncultured Clostridium sp.]|nr:hypothetical protein [Paeniclostridium sordellii]SCI91253.1 Uncharacterised protein [uncultured Clostridium sp.]SCJ03619.1 Uncharacterised protein [uncultured Clostridium sp.]
MKKILLILLLVILYSNIDINGYCDDYYIDNKLNRFIENKVDSRYILLYLNYNYKSIEDKSLKETIIDKFILYNEKYLDLYQTQFDNMYEKNVKNLQTKQNLKSELNILNNIYSYDDINNHKFNFIDNKPNIVRDLKKIYLRGYKIIINNNKFKLTVNYDFLKKAY